MIGGEIDALRGMRVAVRPGPLDSGRANPFLGINEVITVNDERLWGCGLPHVGSSPGKR
jgi:hypothetical protein